MTGSAMGEPGNFETWCEPTSLNRQGDAAPEIDATTVCSTFQEFERGLIGFGNVTIDFHFAPKTSVQQAIAAFELSGDITALRYALPNNGGERIVQGFISQTGEQGANGTLWTGSLTFRSTGAPVTVVD